MQGVLCVFRHSSAGEDKAPKSTSMHIFIPLNMTLLTVSKRKHQSSSSTWTVGPDAPVGTGTHCNCVHISHLIGPFLDFKYVGKAFRHLLTESISAKARRRRRPSLTQTVSAPQPYELVLKLHTVIYSFLFFFQNSAEVMLFLIWVYYYLKSHMHVMAGDHTYVSNINTSFTLFLYFRGCFSHCRRFVSTVAVLPPEPVYDILRSCQSGKQGYLDVERFILTKSHVIIFLSSANPMKRPK